MPTFEYLVKDKAGKDQTGAADAADVLSTVAVVEGKPQRPHRRLVALNARMPGLRCFVVDSVVEQIPGWSSHWSNVSDVRRQLPLVWLPSRAE